MDKKEYYINLKDEINYLKDLLKDNYVGENINDLLFKQEQKAFTVNGICLNQPAQLVRERLKLSSAFLYDVGSTFDFDKYNCFKAFLNDLSEAIDDYDSFDLEALKKIIICLELEMGIEISFYTIFNKMIDKHELMDNYDILKEDFRFDNLYDKYSKKEVCNLRRL